MHAVDERTVRIDAPRIPADPLNENLRARDEISLLVIDFATRRRMKLKRQSEVRSDGAILVHARRVYALCPKYIQAREPAVGVAEPQIANGIVRVERLTQEQQLWIARADTFFIATFHPESGADASHRGGYPGFVRILNTNQLVFPDYSGNKMLNTLGNITANPNAGLLFVDFERGSTLQITGKAQVVWDDDRAAEFPGAERLVRLKIEEAIEIAGATPLRWQFVQYSPFNPA